MPPGNVAALHALAEQTAATIQATVRRWWLDPDNRFLLHIAAERTFVGAQPIVVHFLVRLKPTQTVAAAGRARMQVGVSVEPPPALVRKAAKQPISRPPAKQGRRPPRTTVAARRGDNRKPRARASAPAQSARPKKQVRQVRQGKRQATPKRMVRRKARRVSRG